MKPGRVFFALLLVAAVVACTGGTDLTGKWVIDKVLPPPGGETPEGPPGGWGLQLMSTVFELQQDGTALTGSLVTHMYDRAISDGTVEGDALSFVLKRNHDTEGKSVIPFNGKAVDDKIELTVRPPGGRPPGTVLLKRASDEEILVRAGDVSVKIEPPEIQPLPDNGLARTPPMGWSSWNCFGRDINDAMIREIADAMVESGMRDAGYVYVNIDDGWQGERDAEGVLHANEQFPDMKALADYVHEKGLKLGIYSSPGHRTCANFEGSYGHEEQDARMFADWGIDYIKHDWCGAFRIWKNEEMQAVYQKMGAILQSLDHPIVYSICQYGREDVWKWGADAGGNVWRTTGDIQDDWEAMEQIGFNQDPLGEFARPGHWNDPDMLEVGNGGMTNTEYRTHMSLWVLLASPLLAGNDLRDMTPETLELLTNPEVIAINQDPLGRQARRVAQDGELEVWAKPLEDGRVAAGLFNRGEEAASVTARWADLELAGKVAVRDAWAKKDLGSLADEFTAEVEPHGVVLVVLKSS